jgi:endonuclease/exonuclease/phosphatase (EEP) superfamily protein YafD
MFAELLATPGLTLIEGEVADLLVDAGRVFGVRLADGRELHAAKVVLTTGTLLSLFGSLWWPFDLAANFRPQLAVTLLALGIIHLLVRDPRWALFFMVAAIVNGALVAPYLIGSSPPGVDGPALEVLAFNVGVSNPHRDDVAEYLAADRPDVIVLMESSFEWEDALARRGPTEMTGVATVPDDRVSGITVMVDSELQGRPIELGFGDPSQAVAVSVDLEGTRLEVLSLHPPSPTSGARAQTRDRLLSDAAVWINGRSDPVLVVGDLNATPWSHAYRSLQLRAGLTDTLQRFGLQPSWPAGWGPVMVPIDHALHTAGMVALERSTGPAFGSAHRPVRVTVAADPG